MTINRNAPAFNHNNLNVSITPTEGANNRKAFTFDTAESVKLDGAPKAAAGKGLSIGPVFVVSVAADPSGEFKLTVADESRAMLVHLGTVATKFTFDAVFSRRGLQSRHYQATGCQLDGGIGFDSSSDTPPSDSIKFKCADIKIDGVSIYPPKGQ